MKLSNLLLIGGIAYVIYLIVKQKSIKVEDLADVDLSDVMSGAEPTSLSQSQTTTINLNDIPNQLSAYAVDSGVSNTTTQDLEDYLKGINSTVQL